MNPYNFSTAPIWHSEIEDRRANPCHPLHNSVTEVLEEPIQAHQLYIDEPEEAPPAPESPLERHGNQPTLTRTTKDFYREEFFLNTSLGMIDAIGYKRRAVRVGTANRTVTGWLVEGDWVEEGRLPEEVLQMLEQNGRRRCEWGEESRKVRSE